MKNRKGFTLIEILAVIIILGIIMIIAVPAVSKYILKSDKAVYVTNANAFVETVRGKYEMKEYGPLLNDDQIMIVPIESVILEKGTNESPYGRYEPEKSYVVIVPEKNKYSYYATIIDETNTGIIKSDSNIMSEEDVKVDIVENVPMVSSFETVGAIYEINGKEYKRTETREIIGEDVNQGQYSKVYVFKDITIEPEEQTGIAYTITLNNKGATTPGTTKLYELYTVGWYRDIQVTTMVKKITAPYKNGYEFLGYYTEEDGKGTQIITQSGLIIAGTETIYKSDGTMYAKWVECGDGYYSEDSIKCEICPEGYRDGTELENKTAESACLKNVEAGKHVAVAKSKDVVSCGVNTFANKHTVTYGNTSPCPACTTLGSGYTKSPGGTGETGCYMTLTAGQYVKNKKDKTASSCPKNYYSKDHTVNYGQLSVCTSCTVLGMYYTQSEGGTGETGCYMTVAAGKYKTSSQGMTTAKCAANKYSVEHKSYYDSSDESSCKSCPSGYTCGEGSTDRTACKIKCSINTRVSEKDKQCTATCTGGTTIAEHTISAGSTSAACTTCSNNTGVYTWGSTGCTISTCKAGYGKSGNSCVACAAGTTSSDGNTGCSTCTNNTGVYSWSSACNVSTCKAGYGKSGNSCVACAAGTTSSDGNTGCSTCSNANGVYSWSSACNIATCKAGYGKSGNSCVACASGTASLNGNTGACFQSVFNYSYTGSVQTFTAPATGTYKLEVWGAQGGNALTRTGGQGGYSKGNKYLSKNEVIYVYVGGQGMSSSEIVGTLNLAGGWNGGAAAVDTKDNWGALGSGGGATDMRYGGTNLGNRIIVAGGGGGAFFYGSHNHGYSCDGGAGGGLEGVTVVGGVGNTSSGGTQTSGCSLGNGCTANSGYNRTAGGGGYWGGNAQDATAGGGGSGYIGGVSGGETHAGWNVGNGSAKITWVG